MRQGPKLDVRQATRLSPQMKIVLGIGMGLAAGALLALLIVRVEFNTNPNAAPDFPGGMENSMDASPELDDPPILRRPPPIEKGSTMRNAEDSLFQEGRTVQSLR